ncbi:hypothetical protein Tco_1070574 [Tanacetum coccineum]|uniref:Uncharacterized protein n=1 Tax=Tanacetum coccineum TaxID=301880 RepID=A0ABQ5HNK8_9ASTR
MNQNFYNSSGFDKFQPPRLPVIHRSLQEMSEEVLQARENLMKSIQTFLNKFNRYPFGEIPKVLLVAWERFSEIKHAFIDKQYQPEDIQELMRKLLQDVQNISEELAESTKAITYNLPTEEPEDSLIMEDEHFSTIPEKESDEFIKSSVEDLVPIPSESEDTSDNKSECDVLVCDDSSPLDVLNDYFDIFSNFNDDCTLSDNDSFENIDYVKASPPKDSLIMGNEELSTIPEKELDELIKSNVEDLIPIPRESEDTSGSDSESVLPSSDDFSPIFEEKSVTFSNPLFNSNDYFTSSNDKSLSDEDVLEDVKIYSNPLFEFDDEYISSDVNPLFDEVLEDIECKVSYDSNLDESTFLVTPLSDSNEDECLAPRNNVELLLHHDPSTPMISVAFILEGFIDEPPLEENDDLFDLESKENDWKKILYDAPIDDLITEDKVFDPVIHEKSFSLTFVKLTFEDRHYFPITFVIRIIDFLIIIDGFFFSSVLLGE